MYQLALFIHMNMYVYLMTNAGANEDRLYAFQLEIIQTQTTISYIHDMHKHKVLQSIYRFMILTVSELVVVNPRNNRILGRGCLSRLLDQW